MSNESGAANAVASEKLEVKNGNSKKRSGRLGRVLKHILFSGADEKSAVVHTYPKFLFFWPLIVLGLIHYLIGNQADAIGLCYIGFITVIALAVGFEMDRNLALFWSVFGGLMTFFVLWLSLKLGVPLFREFAAWITSKDVAVSPSFGLLLALVLSVPYLAMFIKVRLNNRWKIANNEIEHYSFGKSDDSLGRGAKRILVHYPDWLELLLCGAGTIDIYTAQGDRKLRSLPNVPWLIFRAKRISRILEATAVTASAADEEHDPVEHDSPEETHNEG